MKRSHAIALGATGLIVAGVWLGQSGNTRIESGDPAADTGKDVQVFANVEECKKARNPFPMLNRDASGNVIPSEAELSCEREFKAASDTHVAAAPKFADAKACETQYGANQCRPASFNGASVFVPAMVGFMVANYLSNQRTPQALLPPRQVGAAPCPPGVTPAQMPGCLMPRQNTGSTSSSSSGSSSSWRSWSTSSGHTVSRSDSAPASSPVRVPSDAASAPAPRTSLGAAPARSAIATSGSRSSSSTFSSSSSVSRGGFGSTGRSASSSS
ncbi:MAG: hypothetical protein FD175_1112 [Beijerinckiaceae bacterium]|nr:MAG: hypothetical protein FD175_1112 [Beijerinckiaceae bacterium]